MKVIKQNLTTHKYKCKECKSIIEIRDDEFKLKVEYPPFPHLMSLADFQHDTMIRTRVCTCPVCHAEIVKETSKLTEELK